MDKKIIFLLHLVCFFSDSVFASQKEGKNNLILDAGSFAAHKQRTRNQKAQLNLGEAACLYYDVMSRLSYEKQGPVLLSLGDCPYLLTLPEMQSFLVHVNLEGFRPCYPVLSDGKTYPSVKPDTKVFKGTQLKLVMHASGCSVPYYAVYSLDGLRNILKTKD